MVTTDANSFWRYVNARRSSISGYSLARYLDDALLHADQPDVDVVAVYVDA
jgi:hypothetical protein